MKQHVSIPLVFACVLTASCRNDKRRDAVLDAFSMTEYDLPIGGLHREYSPNRAFAIERDAIFRLYNEYNAAGESPLAMRTAVRNRISYRMLALIAHYHEGTTDDLYEYSAGIESLFDILGLTFSGLGATTGGAFDRAIYNAINGILIGTRNSLQKNFLAEQTKFAILHQMDALRTSKEAEIRAQLVKHADDVYPLEAVLVDLYDYFNAGSIKDAVGEIAREANQARMEAEEAKSSALDVDSAQDDDQTTNITDRTQSAIARAGTLRKEAMAGSDPDLVAAASITELTTSLRSLLSDLEQTTIDEAVAARELSRRREAHRTTRSQLGRRPSRAQLRRFAIAEINLFAAEREASVVADRMRALIAQLRQHEARLDALTTAVDTSSSGQ